MASKHLSSVPPEARAPRPAPRNISEALDGSSRDVLAAMRKALAKKLDAGEVSSNAIASAYKELRELDRLIRLIDEATAEDARQKNAEGNPGDRRTFDPAAI